MYEKILQKLKDQRGATSNVSDRSLEDLAKSLVTIITTDEILALANLTEAIESIDGNINHYTAEAVKKAKEEEEKEAKKATELAAKKAEEARKKKAGTKTEDPPEWMETMKTIMEQNQKISDDLIALKQEKVTSTRGTQLNTVLKDLPEYLANPIKESFKKTAFENDEAFSTYLQQVEKSGKTFEQAAKEQGLNTTAPSVTVKVPEDTGETTELSDARKLVNKQKEKNAANSNNK